MPDLNDKDTPTCKVSFSEAAAETFNAVQHTMRGPWNYHEDPEAYWKHTESRPDADLAARTKACEGKDAFSDPKKTIAFAGSLAGLFGGAVSGIALKATDTIGITSLPEQKAAPAPSQKMGL